MSLSFCPGTEISATVTSIGVTVCATVDLSSGQSFSPLVAISLGGHKCEIKKGERVGLLASKSI